MGSISYYKVESITNDTVVNFYVGGTGGTGSHWDQASSAGGSGGTNSSGLGGTGSVGEPKGWSNNGAGGGGGGASVARISGTSNRMTASGGKGGTGAYHRFEDRDGWKYYPSRPAGAGGAGGSLGHVISDTSKVKITALSSAQGGAYVSATSAGGMAIRKQRKATGEPIALSSLATGENIVLTNSIDNRATIFAKQANGTFKHSGGATAYESYRAASLEWYHFSKYAVSGTGNTTNLVIRLKPDLTFVGGDGSLNHPFYPEPAGSTTTSGGGSSAQSSDDSEMMANSIISVAAQIETLIQKQEEISQMEMQNKNVNTAPVIESFILMHNATATKSTKPTVELSAYDDSTQFADLQVQFRLTTTGWTTVQSAQNTMTPALTLSPGLNNLYIRVIDASGAVAEKRISIWKI